MRSRLLVERTGMALQASLLLRSSQPEIGDAFCRARLGAERGFALGCLQPGDPVDLLIDRAMPQWGGGLGRAEHKKNVPRTEGVGVFGGEGKPRIKRRLKVNGTCDPQC